jgi:CRP/FNR family transcriptional regulator, anaerobic regulatory protein
MESFLAPLNLSSDAIEALLSTAKQRALSKGVVFFSPPHIFNRMYFITSGLTRCYRLVDGHDVTYHFYLQDEFCVDFYSYLNETPSELYFETLADTELYEFSKATLQRLMGSHPTLERLGRLMAERAYNTVAERLRELQVDTLATRYKKLLDRNPSLFQEIQQRHIATYLGVKPESLSRIKSEVFRRK